MTILCPEFEVGANTDAWDEVLREDDKGRGSGGGGGSKGKRERHGSLAAGGTVWDSGRNWSTVVIEVIPPSTEGRTGNAGRFGPSGGFMATPGTSPVNKGSPFGTPSVSPMPWAIGARSATGLGGGWMSGDEGDEDERDEEDEKIVQVPVFVRVEYEAEVGVDDAGDPVSGDGKRERKEHAYWCVLYLGKIGTGGPTSGLGAPGTPAAGGVGLRDAGGGVGGGLGVGVGVGVGAGSPGGVMSRVAMSSSKSPTGVRER